MCLAGIVFESFVEMDFPSLWMTIVWCVALTSSMEATRLFGEGGCGEGSVNCSVIHSSKTPDHEPRSRFEIFAGGNKAGVDFYDHDVTGSPPHNSHDPYEKGEGKMWLVPPFLIGACSVILVYIIVHCLYLHCYAKRKLQHMQPTLVFSDDVSNSSMQTFTPIVKYDPSRGQTELLVCRQNYDQARRKSSHLQLPFFRQKQPRMSMCSASSVVEQAVPPLDGEEPGRPGSVPDRKRASFCLVPVGRKASGKEEWLPLQSFMCQSNMFNVNPQSSACPHCGSNSSVMEPVTEGWSAPAATTSQK